MQDIRSGSGGRVADREAEGNPRSAGEMRWEGARCRNYCLRSLGALLLPVFWLTFAPPAAADELDFLFDDEPREERRDEPESQAPARDERQLEREPEMAEEGTDIIPIEEDDTVARTRRQPVSRIIEEIRVTAQRREEDLSDVPISVQAFSADRLEAQGVESQRDLPKITPGLTVTQQVGYASTFIRGIGSDAFLLADPSVTTYVDGVYYPFALNLVQDFGAVERVEVLKGPQGTLFGRNAIGGAINIVSRDPQFDAFEGGVRTIYGFHNERDERSRTRAYLSGPFTDWLAFGADVIYNTEEYHVDGRFGPGVFGPDLIAGGGKPLPRSRERAGRFKLRIAPFDWLDVHLQASRLEAFGVGGLFQVNTEPSLLGTLAGIQPQDRFAGQNNEDIFTDNTTTTYAGRIEASSRWFDVRLFGSDQLVESFQNVDFDGSPQPLALFQIEPGFADVQTAEFQILSNDTSWRSDRFEWIAGVYFFQSTQGLLGFLQTATTNLDEGIVLGVPLPAPLAQALGNLGEGLPIPSGSIDFVGINDTDSLAFYGQLTGKITDWLSLTVGLRRQKEKRLLVESSAGLRTLDGGVIPLQSFSGNDDPRFRDTTRSLDPKVSLDFRPNWRFLGDNPLVYLSYQTATKASTFNVVNITNEPDFVEPEEIRAWELGYKTSFGNGLVTLSAALFDYRLENQQVQFVSLLEGGAVTFENAAEARSRGVEFDVLTQVFPDRLGNLVATASAAFVNARYASFPDGSGFDPDTGLLNQNNDFSGNPVVRSPDFTGNIGLTQTFENVIAGGALEIGANLSYNSGYFFLPQATPNVEEPPFALFDARITYLQPMRGLSIALFGNNLLGREYNIGRFPNDFGTADIAAPKREVGLRLSYDF